MIIRKFIWFICLQVFFLFPSIPLSRAGVVDTPLGMVDERMVVMIGYNKVIAELTFQMADDQLFVTTEPTFQSRSSFPLEIIKAQRIGVLTNSIMLELQKEQSSLNLPLGMKSFHLPSIVASISVFETASILNQMLKIDNLYCRESGFMRLDLSGRNESGVEMNIVLNFTCINPKLFLINVIYTTSALNCSVDLLIELCGNRKEKSGTLRKKCVE